jgi:tight adherence protein B
MGVLVGLVFGLGLFLVLVSGGPRPVRRRRAGQISWDERTRELLARAGVEQVTPRQLVGMAVGLGLTTAVAALVLTRIGFLALGLGVAAGVSPRTVLHRRARQRTGMLRELWPDVVDNLASAVRAGLSLPEALTAAGVRGPEALRPAFRRFGEDYRATGSFGPCLDRLEESMADPVADRVCETLRMAREVGGSDVGTVLRTLSQFLREDARTRAELETRQSWTVNAARLALAAPWAVLVLLAIGSSTTVDAYNRPAGVVVLAVGGGVSVVAYQLMRRLGRLPADPRVLRPKPGGLR